MGGIWVDYDLQTTIPGLFAIGEANFSDHGGNRLGASALMQGLADGYFILPITIGDYLSKKFATEGDIKNIETGINYVKNMRLSDEQISELKTDVERFADIYNLYQSELRKMKLMDYDDQMVYALVILQRYPEVLQYFRNLYKYICVDEAQDIKIWVYFVLCWLVH